MKRGINHGNVAAAAAAAGVQAARDALFCIIYHGEAPPVLIYVLPAGAKQPSLACRSEDEGSGWTGPALEEKEAFWQAQLLLRVLRALMWSIENSIAYSPPLPLPVFLLLLLLLLLKNPL